MRPADWVARLGVYVIADWETARRAGRDLLALVEPALAGGATCLQWRAKGLDDRQALSIGAGLQAAARRRGALFIVNDRLDWALALGADGVHLGDTDLPVGQARRLADRLGREDFVIGASVDSPAGARQAAAEGADYLGVGPMFATATKADAGPPIGPGAIAAIRAASNLPVIGIGGITAENAAAVLAAGAAGVCVAAAVLLADDPGAAADALRRAVASRAADAAKTTPRPAAVPPPTGAGAAIVPTARPHRRTPADPHTRPHLQVVADPRAVADWPAFAAAVAAGGADSLQIRAPGAGGGELLGWAEAALRAAPHLAIIVGERADVARMAGASGVQLPERGLPVGRARRAWAGLRWGRSVHDVEGAMRAGTEGADWLVFGHVFPTDSKPDQPARGVRMLAEVVASVSIPVLAIGGIRAGNAAAVIQAGAAGVAVMGAATRAQDPRGATAAIRAALDGAGPARPAEEGASCASI